jgi:Mrp family chromosome partitioning ATPase
MASHHPPNMMDRVREDERIAEVLGKIKHKVLVMSGKGGVGKSTIAANLAVALANAGQRIGLLDIDLHGPSVPGLLGLSGRKPGVEGDAVLPIEFSPNLKMLSIGNLLQETDAAVIWRGPMKISAIRQLISDVQWGELDVLVIDSPPGTGDEPLTVAQTIPGAVALIVTTPQEISLADVRKSIQFCRSVNMPILGIVENMAGFVCPKCGHIEPLFGIGGGGRTAKQFGLPLLGSVPLDPAIMRGGDAGVPYAGQPEESPAKKAFGLMVDGVRRELAKSQPAE